MTLPAALLGAVLVGCRHSDAPANGSIAASFARTGGVHLFDPDDGTQRAVLGTRGGFAPGWSRDGRWIAFTRSRIVRTESGGASVDDLYVVRPDGTEAPRLVARNASGPSWSPDGKEIVFMRDVCPGLPCLDVENPYELFVVALESGDERRLSVNEFYDGDPAWSPDGDWIAFASEEGLALVHPHGRDRRELTTKWEHWGPSWSPDGKHIAFADINDIYVISIDGGRPRRLTDNRGPDLGPTWSPDGTRIAYLSNHVCAQRSECTAHEPMHIRIMNPDGSESRAITEDGWSAPSWGPRSEAPED